MKVDYSRVFLMLVVGVLSAFVLSCSGEAQDQAEPPQDTATAPTDSADFAITFPKSDSEVSTNEIMVRGEGARPGGVIVIRVLTDAWYIQDGKYNISHNGEWTFALCNLKGKGQYRRNHTIEATLMVNGQVVATSSVSGVTAPEP